MSLPELYPGLAQLLADYLREDWPLWASSYHGAIGRFAATARPEVVQQALADISALLESPMELRSFELGLEELDCRFAAPSAGPTAREWLLDVRRLLEAAG